LAVRPAYRAARGVFVYSNVTGVRLGSHCLIARPRNESCVSIHGIDLRLVKSAASHRAIKTPQSQYLPAQPGMFVKPAEFVVLPAPQMRPAQIAICTARRRSGEDETTPALRLAHPPLMRRRYRPEQIGRMP
jgi:hypothetical protein